MFGFGGFGVLEFFGMFFPGAAGCEGLNHSGFGGVCLRVFLGGWWRGFLGDVMWLYG